MYLRFRAFDEFRDGLLSTCLLLLVVQLSHHLRLFLGHEGRHIFCKLFVWKAFERLGFQQFLEITLRFFRKRWCRWHRWLHARVAHNDLLHPLVLPHDKFFDSRAHVFVIGIPENAFIDGYDDRSFWS